ADADRGAGGKAGVGRPEARDDGERGAEPEAGHGDIDLPAVAAIAGEARVGAGPGGNAARRLGQRLHRLLERGDRLLGRAYEIAGQDRGRPGSRLRCWRHEGSAGLITLISRVTT